jgi:hypothetical protein
MAVSMHIHYNNSSKPLEVKGKAIHMDYRIGHSDDYATLSLDHGGSDLTLFLDIDNLDSIIKEAKKAKRELVKLKEKQAITE